MSTADRNVNDALNWVENLLDGKIVNRVEHKRWRPQWFLDLETRDGRSISLLLRGWRAPGTVENEEGSRQRLQREAGVLAALDKIPVKSPRYYGYESRGDWILMERVAGTELLTEISDAERQRDLFLHYIEDIAALHKIDPDEMDLPETLYRPKDHESNATWNYRWHQSNYRANESGPDPLFEFAWAWLDKNRPAPVDRYSLCTGDIGANQFLFSGNEYKCLFDVEMAYIGDPLQDIGLMRYRNTCYPVVLFEDVVRHYFRCMERDLDIDSLNYWTVIALLGIGPTFAKIRATPDPKIAIDMTLIWAMHNRRRSLAAIFHQIYGLDTPPLPEFPAKTTDHYSKYHQFVVDAISECFLPQAKEDEAHHLKYIRAHAEIARRCSEIGAEITRLNLDDLGAILGKRPVDELSGLRLLEESVKADPERDLQARLDAMFRIEARIEHLMEPAIHAVGFPSFAPLDTLSKK